MKILRADVMKKNYLVCVESNLHGQNFFHDVETLVMSQRFVFWLVFLQQFSAGKIWDEGGKLCKRRIKSFSIKTTSGFLWQMHERVVLTSPGVRVYSALVGHLLLQSDKPLEWINTIYFWEWDRFCLCSCLWFWQELAQRSTISNHQLHKTAFKTAKPKRVYST